MSTYQPTIQDITNSGIDIDVPSETAARPLPYLVSLPLIGITSIGLWIGLYKVGCGLFGMLA